MTRPTPDRLDSLLLALGLLAFLSIAAMRLAGWLP